MIEEIAELLIKEDASENPMIEAKDSYGRLPIQDAIIGGHIDSVNLIMRHNKSLIHVKDNDGMTSLHHVALLRDQQILQNILQAGGDIDLNEKYNFKNLHKKGTTFHGALPF